MTVHGSLSAQATGKDGYLNFIDGRHVPPTTGAWIDNFDPSTGKAWARVPASGVADVDAAVEAARRALRGPWSRLSVGERAGLMRRLAALAMENVDELARLESRGNGRLYTDTSRGDIPGVAGSLTYYAGAADKIFGETIEGVHGAFCYVRRPPVGVVAAILPWNGPLVTLLTKLAPALAAGCTVVAKPAESSSVSTLVFARLIAEAGFPDGVVNIVSGLGSVVGDALAGHRDVAKIALTGSTATARAITRRSADAIKQLGLELGGKSANIVFADANLEAAAAGTTTGSIFNGGAGQACLAGSRVLVQRSIHDEFVERMVKATGRFRLGDPMDPATQMGPLSLDKQFDKVRSYLALGKDEGAELLMGGRHGAALFEEGDPLQGGYWVEPTIFIDAHNNMRIAREEIFGPVVAVIPFEDEEEAIAIANDSNYGLAAGVWTQDLRRAHRVVDAIDAGLIWVNAYRKMAPGMPFGGVKDSGYGRDGGLEALRSYTYAKSVWMDLA
jgi:acyl-CoA reductase-like NAD-dependent aldehyde dehydrogenase